MAKYENELRKLLEVRGYIVIRSAGSMGEADLILINPKNNRAKMIECKAVAGDRFYTTNTKKNKEQYDIYKKRNAQGLDVWYAVRFKGLKHLHGQPQKNKWKFYRVGGKDYPILRETDGLILKDFINT